MSNIIIRFTPAKALDDATPAFADLGTIDEVAAATLLFPHFEVNPPLMSRSTLFRLHALDTDALTLLARRGLTAEGATADDDAVEHLVQRCGGDGRHLLTSLEVAVALAAARATAAGESAVHLSLDDAEGGGLRVCVSFGQE